MNIFFGKARKLDVKLVILTQILNIGFTNIGYGRLPEVNPGNRNMSSKKLSTKLSLKILGTNMNSFLLI